MSWTTLGTIVFLNVVGSLVPGPDSFFLLRLAARSRSHALVGMLGIITGLLVWVTLTVTGAAALLSTYPQVLNLIKVVGGGYLMWTGVRFLRLGITELIDAHQFGNSASLVESIPGSVTRLPDYKTVYRQGLVTNLSNPKVVMYFAAILAPLMPAHPSPLLAVGIILAIVSSNIVTFGLLCLLVSTRKVQKRMLRAGPFLDLVAGVVFCLVAVTLFYEVLTELF